MSGGRWTSQSERGSSVLLRVMIWLTLTLGWTVAQALLIPITAWFFASSPRARAASRDFLARALDRPPTASDVFRHLHNFSRAILDRVFVLSNRLDEFDINLTGLDHLTATLKMGRGCVLLGSHLGSFELLRALGRDAPVRVRALMFRRNAGGPTRILEALDPALRDSIIEIGAPGAMLEVRESLARGEIVGILGDRVPGERKFVETDFLGSKAAFPAGPIILAATLGAPVVLFYGLRTGPRRYDVRFEPFAERIILPRAERMEALRSWVERYADRLEAMCRAHPFNWFNFYPFWETPPNAEPEGPHRPAAASAGRPPSGGARRGRAEPAGRRRAG
ncbi:MAG: acyltransferase [Acetobacteraceae bacterium]